MDEDDEEEEEEEEEANRNIQQNRRKEKQPAVVLDQRRHWVGASVVWHRRNGIGGKKARGIVPGRDRISVSGRRAVRQS